MAYAQREVKIQNELGLHARPAAKFMQLANKFRCKISVKKDGESVNGKSVMGMMMLAAGKGTSIVIEANGQDALRAVKALEELVEERFGED